jgi:hypothetical protein
MNLTNGISERQEAKLKRARPSWLTRHLYHHPQLTTPAMRMLLIGVSSWNDGPDIEEQFEVEIFPVLALESRTQETWRKTYTGDMPNVRECRSAEEFESAGFHFGGSIIAHGVLIVWPEWGAVVSTIDAEYWASTNATYQTVVCQWPESDDEKRLVAIINEMKLVVTGGVPF